MLDQPVSSVNMAGTPANGQKIMVRRGDDGNGPYQITWGPAFVNSGIVELPAATIVGERISAAATRLPPSRPVLSTLSSVRPEYPCPSRRLV